MRETADKNAELFVVFFEDADGIVAAYEVASGAEEAVLKMQQRIQEHMPDRASSLTFLDCRCKLDSPEAAHQASARPHRVDETEQAAITWFPVQPSGVEDRLQALLAERSQAIDL